MVQSLILAAVLLVPLAAFDGLAQNTCSIRIYRSPDRSALMIRINNNRYIYLNLVENPEHPTIQFYVETDRVSVFDKQANAEMKTLSSLQTLRDQVSRQFQHYRAQFDKRPPAARLQGRQIWQQDFFRRDKFLIEWLPGYSYRVDLEDMPDLSITLEKDTFGQYYKIQSPLLDLTTQISRSCGVQVFHQGALLEPAQFGPMHQPLRSDGGWNPMDANSWTLFDNRNQQAGSSSSGGFRFARPLKPTEPDDPDEVESLWGHTMMLRN